ncbi:MAG: type II secretion system protein GspN [Desulfosarcinaceae bacterium]
MKRTGKIVLYTAFSALAVLFFLFWRFPSDLARNLIMAQLNQVHPELEIASREVHPTFPPGLVLTPFDISYAGVHVLDAEQLKIKPSLLSLIGQQKNFSFSASLGGGDLKGNAEVTLDDKRPKILLAMNLENVSLDSLQVLKQWPQYQPSGDVKAYIDYDSQKGAEGTAKINLDVTPARIVFTPPIMGLEQIEFSQVQAEMSMTPRMLQIRHCEASGTQIESRISGSIIFREPMDRSRVTLSCTLKPQPAFIAEHKSDMLGGLLGTENAQKRGVVLRISGTLGNPRYIIR